MDNSDYRDVNKGFDFSLYLDHKRIDRLVFVPLYGLELLAILLTNSFLLYMLKSPESKKDFSFNVQCFFTLRALGDLFSGLICIPLHVYISFFRVPDPSRLHKVCREDAALWYLEEVGAYISSYTILAIAICRFKAVLFPFSKKIGRTEAIAGLIIVLILSFGLPITFTVVRLKFTTGVLCRYSQRQFKSHLSYLIIIGMIIPYTISVILYYLIIHRLKRTKNSGEGLLNSKTSDEKKDRSIKMIWWLISIFVICNAPILSFHFFSRFNFMKLSDLNLERILHCVALWFTMIRWLNPLIIILFGIRDKNTRILKIMATMFSKSSPSTASSHSKISHLSTKHTQISSSKVPSGYINTVTS
ncbi:unnamed protein product [Gordionus sp. m RMFG-2023]|uniref:RYamide receptor-like n=1 Tax=Gordionus sp. m RMFG-2023 TaxID=3053472 RepID=UPI0030E5ED15